MKYYIFALALFATIFSFAQCPTATLILTTQAEIDDFAIEYPGCSDFEHELIISGNDITNLNGLSSLISVSNGVLRIRNNPNLLNLSGLNNIQSLPGGLHIENNAILNSIEDLSDFNYNYLGQLTIKNIPNLTSINGLNGIIEIGNLTLDNVDNLLNVDDLSSINEIGSNLIIKNNENLQNLNGIENSYQGLYNLKIENNPSLLNLDGLKGVSIVIDNLYIINNDLITSLEGLNNINGNFNWVEVSILIQGNEMLDDISAIEQIDSQGITAMSIYNNPNLSVCSYHSVCLYISSNGNYYIQDNAPGCNTAQEIIATCNTCPTGNLVFTTQSQIDNFATNYPNCESLNVELRIEGSNITDLSGLSQIKSMSRKLTIQNCTNLVNIDGLDIRFRTHESYIIVKNNPNLETITSLTSEFSFTRQIQFEYNDVLTSIIGLSGLERVSTITIYNNESLINLNGLEDVVSNSQIHIGNNNSLENISALSNLVDESHSDTSINNNPSLVSLNGLQGIHRAFAMYIHNNDSLTDLSGLEGLNNIEEVEIYDNESLISLEGLNNISRVEFLDIRNNPSLLNLNGLDSFSVFFELYIDNNDSLTSLNGIEGLTNEEYIWEYFVGIVRNDNLTDISALENLDYSNMDYLSIFKNPSLSECSIQSICSYLDEGTGTSVIHDNGPNCESENAVLENCGNTLNEIIGNLTYDYNNDNCDVSDYPVQGILVKIADDNISYTTLTDDQGNYSLFIGEGTYSVAIVETSLPEGYDATPISAEVVFTDFGNNEVVDFCITAINPTNDLKITLLPLNDARPGFDSEYEIVYENVGTTLLSGDVTLEFDIDRQNYLSSLPIETSIIDNTISWEFTDLIPFESRTIVVKFNNEPPPINDSGDILIFTATINPILDDATPDDNVYNLDQIIVNSQDPNDKLVLQGRQILEEQVGDYLDYKIRFQNIGTADAINVLVTDQLSENLDWNTFRIISSSHDYRVEIVNENSISFYFDNINLPAEQDDPEGSNGYVSFQVRTKSDLVLGEIIENEANIYFDFNAPIFTNLVITEIVDELGMNDFNVSKHVALYPNPVSDVLRISMTDYITFNHAIVYSVLGEKLIETSEENIDFSNLSEGMYFVEIETVQGSISKKIIKK